jgi:hypothetical protein
MNSRGELRDLRGDFATTKRRNPLILESLNPSHLLVVGLSKESKRECVERTD